MYKKLFIIALLQCSSFLGFTQTIIAIDSISQKKIYGFKVIVVNEISAKRPQYKDTLWATKKGIIEKKKKYKTLDGIIYYIVSHPDYREKKVEEWETKEVIVPLVRNGISEEFSIQLFTIKEQLDSVKKKRLESVLNVKSIDEIVNKEGKYVYATPPMKNLYKSIDQLERLKATKNPEIKDSYLLFARTKTQVYFRVQFAVAHDWMVEEFKTPSDLLENRYSLKQIQTEDNLHRVVSKMKYNDYAEAVKAFSEKVRVRITNRKTVIIACTKIGNKERVITSMNL